MLNVFITVDVEVWCGGWDDLEQKFPNAFRQYVYGRTAKGDYGLPYQLDILNGHGLKGVFFVEPLFSTRFGIQPLAEIVGLLDAGGQDVELHMHTEWVGKSDDPLLEQVPRQHQHMRHFSLEQQTVLIRKGLDLLRQAGAEGISAFRAGNFGFNIDTLRALAANGIRFDSSYNASLFGPDSGVMPDAILVSPVECEGVFEYPMTVFDDGTGSLRHAQLGACSYTEMEKLLWQALEDGRDSFVILSHNFELLNQAHDRPDDVVVRRFLKLCSFLDRNRDCFHTRGFRGLVPYFGQQAQPLVSPIWRTGARMLEQVYRRSYG